MSGAFSGAQPISTHSKLYEWLAGHRLMAFLLMTLAFVLFGLLSLDLVRLVSANTSYLLSNGWAGWVDGGFMQLLELALNALFAIASYLVFKLCEHVLVHRLAHQRL